MKGQQSTVVVAASEASKSRLLANYAAPHALVLAEADAAHPLQNLEKEKLFPKILVVTSGLTSA
jgi:hypothetical protein